MKYTEEIKKPKLYRLIYVHEGMGCNVKFYSTSKMHLKKKLSTVQDKDKEARGRFWIIQENVSNTEKEFWTDLWVTIERTPEIDLLFAPEPMTEIERHYQERL